MEPGGHPIRWTRDVTAADWWRAGLDPSYDRLGALMPGGYQAYARLLHPAPIGADARPVSWRALAERHGRVVHSKMRFSGISRLPGQTVADQVRPPPGTLPLPEAQRLVELLRTGTATPDRCWFCRSADERWVDDQGVTERVALPSGGNDYLLHQGPIELALVSPPLRDDTAGEGHIYSRRDLTPAEMEEEYIASRHDLTPVEMQAELAAWRAGGPRPSERPAQAGPEETPYGAPRLWWSDDRTWFVAMEADLASTYVGGARAFIDRLMADSHFETFEASLTDSLAELDDWPNAELDRRAQTW